MKKPEQKKRKQKLPVTLGVRENRHLIHDKPENTHNGDKRECIILKTGSRRQAAYHPVAFHETQPSLPHVQWTWSRRGDPRCTGQSWDWFGECSCPCRDESTEEESNFRVILQSSEVSVLPMSVFPNCPFGYRCSLIYSCKLWNEEMDLKKSRRIDTSTQSCPQ